MPALFIGHGSPMNALEDNEFTRGWQDAARRLPKPKAILCISAHWETRGVGVCSAVQPETIHDFGGFPQELFDVRYPAPGDPALAQRVAAMVKKVQVHVTPQWGLDHGAWSVLRVMYPDAGIPVVQLSLDSAQAGPFHLGLARELAPLRDEGVLILGSGNIVHNLRLWNFRDPTPADWAVRANALLRGHIAAGDTNTLADWPSLGPDVALAVPTPEHYLPLLYTLGARREGDGLHIFNDVVTSSLAMTSVMVG
ncbi:MAG TPA: 4,5-DOPA dioxygenase extradiol [Rudaea sp.]|nr:4,5-DOPA dioxygenase extradiol [Rudaea sp.]